jgi:hypothetical protein
VRARGLGWLCGRLLRSSRVDRPSHTAKSAGLYGEEILDSEILCITDPWGRVFQDPPDAPMDPAPPHLHPPDDRDESAPF